MCVGLCVYLQACLCVSVYLQTRVSLTIILMVGSELSVPSTPVHFANGMKNYLKKPSSIQDSAVDPSEEQPWPRGTLRHITESPFGLSGGLREGSLSSQDSRTESASLSQSQVNGFFASHLGDRGWQEQHGSPSPSVASKVTEKTFSDGNRSKADWPGISDAAEHSDRADSDTDDPTCASSQDHQTPKKAWFDCNALWAGHFYVFVCLFVFI